MKFLVGRNVDGVGQVIEVDCALRHIGRVAASVQYVTSGNHPSVDCYYRFVQPGEHHVVNIGGGETCVVVLVEDIKEDK